MGHDASAQPGVAPQRRADTRLETCREGERGQVSIVRALVLVAVLAFVLFEGGAVFINRYQVSDIASQAATEANIVYFGARNLDSAEERAKEFVEQNGAAFIDLAVDENAQTMSVTAEKTAKTIVVQRIDALKKQAVVRTTQSVPLRK